MVEQLVLLEIMELNTEMSSMNITGTGVPTAGLLNHNLIIEDPSECEAIRELSIIHENGLQEMLSTETGQNAIPIQESTEAVEVDENKSKIKLRRSQRKRIRPADNKSDFHDQKKVQKMNNDLGDVEKYYLCKKVKRLPSTLETIFEEPKEQNNKQLYVSTRKFKRTLHFDEDLAGTTRLKFRKRQLKAKKLASSKNFLNRKKVSMDTLLNKLSSIDSDKE